MRTELKALIVALIIFNFSCVAAIAAESKSSWKIGTPITTYYQGGGPMEQMAAGGFNLIMGGEKEFDPAHKFGLRVMLGTSELWRVDNIIGDTAKTAAVDALIERVKNHPAMYSYFIVDEPSSTRFDELGKLVAHLRAKDPAHLAWINLFPTNATNDQLGTKGDVVQAYREYLRLYIEKVKPGLLSYDHYHFNADGTDGNQYFLNLALVREAALGANIPFMNCVQACTWSPGMRAPSRDEMRWLNYTSLAYGAQALMYFVYNYEPFYTEADERGVDPGGMMRPDGTTTLQYRAAQELNPQFVAIATQVQPLRSLGAYHVGRVPLGAIALPQKASFTLDFSGKNLSRMPEEGMLLGYFGKSGKSAKPTHVLVVNLNHKAAVTTTIVGPSKLSSFDAVTGIWTPTENSRLIIALPPGGGRLLRVK